MIRCPQSTCPEFLACHTRNTTIYENYKMCLQYLIPRALTINPKVNKCLVFKSFDSLK